MIKNIFKNKKGITLLELVVAVGIFSLTIVSATQIFKAVIDGQRSAIASQNIQESVRYALERMSKEIRMAKRDKAGYCSGLPNRTYRSIMGQNLHFLNYRNECIYYYAQDDRLFVRWDPPGPELEIMPLTPASIKVNNLRFDVIDPMTGTFQPRVTIIIELENNTDIEKHENPIFMQTTVSLRRYR